MQLHDVLSKKTAIIILALIAVAIVVVLYRPRNLQLLPDLGPQLRVDWTWFWEKLYSLGPILNGVLGFTVGSLIFFAINLALRMKDKRQEKKKEFQQVLKEFGVFFEEGESVLSQYQNYKLTESTKRGGPVDPQLLVAKDRDALRDNLLRIEGMIGTRIKSKAGFHLIHVQAGSKQGRSVFLWRLVRDLIADRTKDRIRAEFWVLKSDVSFQSRDAWNQLILTTKSFMNVNKGKSIALFLEDPFRKFKPAARSQSALDSEDNFWRTFQREFADFSNLTVVAISSFWKIPQDEENARNVSRFGLLLTRNDVSNILRSYADFRGWKEPEKEVSVFLSQPGILEKCAGNLSYLLYRLELFHISPAGNIHSILGSDTEFLVEKYEEWEDNDPKKNILLFVAYVNLLGLLAPDWLFLDVKKRDWDALVMDFLERNDAKEWELRIPFLPHILLQEKIDRIKSEDASYEHLSGFFIDLLSKWVARSCFFLNSRDEELSMEASDFIRNLIHFTAEEKYRPALTFSGYKIAQSLFKDRIKEIREFVEHTLMQMMQEDDSTVAHIRRWASTFAAFGLMKEADEFYQHILEELPNVRPDKKIRIMIPLARGLAEIHIDDAVKIYHTLLFDPQHAQSKLIQRKALLTSAVDVLLRNNKAPIAIEWMEKLRPHIDWDSLLWLKEGSVREELGGEDNLKKAEECFRKAIDESDREIRRNRKTKLNSLHRYAIFLIRNERNLPVFAERPIIDSLLDEAEKIAVALKENVEGIYSARAEYFQENGEPVKALEQYRKAVDWCRIEGIPNSRPYSQLANFLLENSVKLSETAQIRSQYLEEAERCLTEILFQSEQSYGQSRRSLFSILGRLVGGTVGREETTEVPYHYQFQDKQRPNYDEALTFLDEAFESNSHDRFDPQKKTFQDVRVHTQVKDVLINKAMEMTNKEERCRCLKEAQEHFKAAFEGFPQLGSSAREKEKWHTVTAIDAYAGFIWQWLEDQDCLDKKEGNNEADKYYERAEARMKEWGLDSKRYDKAYDMHSHRVIFLFQSGKIPRLKRPSLPGMSESDIPGVPIIPLLDARDSAVKAALCNERALEVLSPQRVDYEKCFRLSVGYLLMVLRALVRDSDCYPNNEKETSRWIQKYVEVTERLLNQAKSMKPSICAEITKEINRFTNDRHLDRCWSENRHLKTKLENVCLAYGYKIE